MLSDQELDGHGFSESNQKFGGCLILKRKKFPIEDSELYYDRYGPSEIKVSEDIVYFYAYHYPKSCIWAQDYFVLEDEEVKEGAQGELGAEDDSSLDSGVLKEDSDEWDEFGDMEDRSVDKIDPGSWINILEEALSWKNISSTEEGLYISGVNKMMFAVSEGESELTKEAISDLHLAADGGYVHAQSTLGFLYEIGSGVEQSDAKDFLYHHFAAEGGNFQSKMALAYTYYRQQVTTPADNVVYSLKGTSGDKFQFLAPRSRMYKLFFHNSFSAPETIPFYVHVGHIPNEHDIAKDEHLNTVNVRITELREEMESVTAEQQYLKARDARHRRTF